jgi:antirestriction protein ArdC
MSHTKITTRKSADERRAEADTLHESIGSQLEELTSTKGWARFLKFATGFHSYSLSNALLILSQRPDASRVAGFRQWQQRGRQVRKGERAIKIYGYATKRTEDENGEEERRAYFPILSVFDVSQTEQVDGEEILELAPRLLGGDDAGIYNAAAGWLTGQGWSINRAPTGQANGYTQHTSRTITIHDDLQPAQAAATMLHEAAHALMHADATDYHQHRGIYETEAESVAYIVAGVLGFDTSSKSIGYIAGWARGDVETVKATATRVLATVRTILDGITVGSADDSDK